MDKPLIIIYGATATGKTDAALAFANQASIEIINADVGQFYTPLSIGTAKPDWQNSQVPHHLFDIIDEPKDLTVEEYRKRVSVLIHDIWARGNTPLIVGGSGFYLLSLFFPPEAQHGEYLLDEHMSDIGQAGLWEYLLKIDPDRAQQIHPQDTYRIKRALAIWFTTQQKPSELKPHYQPVVQNPFLLFLDRDRNDLYDRINKRTTVMLTQGWIDEVRRLEGTPWQPFLMRKKLIGYNDIFEFFATDQTQKDRKKLEETIAKKTRNYAKRQNTFWRMFEKKIVAECAQKKQNACPTIKTLNLTSSELERYINQLKIVKR